MQNRSSSFYAVLLDITILGTAIAISGVLFFQYHNTVSVTADTREERYFRPVDPTEDLIYGNPEAELFIVEYGDLECPYCKDFHPNAKELIKSNWGISGKVAWVWRNGFHINLVSVEKARVLECVRLHGGEKSRTRAWGFIEESLLGGVLEREYPYDRYKEIIEQLGLSFERIEQCRKDNETARKIAIAARDVKELNITETPYLQFVSGSGELLYESVGLLTTSQIESFVASIFRNLRNE